MSAPNLISVMRLVLIPVFLVFLAGNRPAAALAVFVVASISDALDGIVARRTNNVTPLGVFLDPMADKILILSAFIALAYIRAVPPWLAIIVVFRDILLFTGWIALNILKNLNIISPSVISKITTFFQMAVVIFVLFDLSEYLAVYKGFLNILFILTGFLTAITGIHYIFRAVRLAVKNSEKQ